MSRTRTFIGIDVGGEVCGAASALQKELAKASSDVKWVTADSMHVTLLFLGDVDDRELHAVCKAAKRVVAPESPFALRVSGVGAFPNARRPKVLWAGITDGAEALQRLNAGLEEAMLELGCYRTEERGYTPHLTLGRVNSAEAGFVLAAELPKRLAWQGGRTTVDEVLIYGSVLDRDGPVYSVIGRAPLTGA
ncbi:MAG: RNA 2',3'-cyclic phosphodiesterase [Gemmataceae bacterium]|nr:RNA 2',3'-cyclic phosphodiesterase [Gemmataceae bacterium]